jgi:cytochrome P450
VFTNQWAINHDPRTFVEPHKFCARRFIRPDDSYNSELAQQVQVEFSHVLWVCGIAGA